MSLNHLSNETLIDVFLYLEQDQKHALAILSRTSRRFHNLVEPILYSSLIEKTKESLFNYLWTLIERPHLGRYVKLYRGCQPLITKPIYHSTGHTMLAGWVAMGKDTLPLPSGMSKTVRQAFDQIIFLAGEPDGDRWYNDIIRGQWHAVTALVLTYLPNIRSLYLGVVGDRNWHQGASSQIHPPYFWLKRSFMRAALLQDQQISSPLALDQLTTLTLVRDKGEDGANPHLSQLMSLLYLTSLKKFVASGWFFPYWNTRPKIQLRIVDLELVNCTFEPELFAEDEDVFFEWFPYLERLRCQHTDNNHHFHPQIIAMLIQSLNRVQPPLRELYFGDTSDWNSIRELDETKLMFMSNDVQVESLSPLGILEVLDTTAFDQWTNSIDVQQAPLAEMLPSSIKLLTLRHASRATTSYARSLLESRYAVPELHTLRIFYGEDTNLSELREEIASLKEEGQRCGVEITI